MSGFSKNWQKKEDRSSRELRNLMRNSPPVKLHIDRASREISALIARLDNAEARIKSRDGEMFRKIVAGLQKGDKDHAAMYANELTEMRKVGMTVVGAKLALEQVSLRLGTITDLGDVVSTLLPTVTVVKRVGQGLVSIMPKAQGELNEISSLLSSTLVEAGTIGGTSLNFQAANSEAEQVLEEAAPVASETMAAQFPEVPAVVPQRTEEEEGVAV